MKKIHRALALIMAIAVICCLPIQASAANEAAAVIDYSKTASLSLYKYDLTSAEADGAWDTDAYVSTGIYDQSVNDAMGSYAVQGVEFMSLRVADISLYTEKTAKRILCLWSVFVLGLTLFTGTAYADGDPLTIVNNLSDFIFSCIKAIGIIILGWGVVQVGMSIQSHDASQRSQGFLCLFGGLVITFAKEILTAIGVT